MTATVLPSWRDGAAKQAIVDFVERTCGATGVPVEERVAVFDNDGTLWCEQPMPIQLDKNDWTTVFSAGPVATEG